ncbi:FecR family protein [Bacteroides congonensis]|jgi:transmembrane sensor|uniref:FecR family protein n=1 Tax=Bacteroides congonensis TaxID=1871006 RepID=UPI00093394AD|nr:FecR family protein [Bacteroides congonensis]
MNPIENIPDFVVYALSTPEVQPSEELKQWLAQSQANRDLFDELLAYREAERRLLLPANIPDIDLQWERVKRKNRQKRIRYYWTFVGVAASLLLVLSVGLYQMKKKSKLESQDIETQISLADVIDQPKTTIITYSENKSRPIILSTQKGKTTAIHTHVLDYTQTSHTQATELLTLTTPRGKSIQVILDDSTKVWLNAESRLSYPSQFTDSTRTVHLEGEAYFKVAANAKCPFIVKHHANTTRALGTEFNIRSYTDEKKHVTLIEGKVLLTDTLSLQKEILLPGQDAEYDSDSKMTIKKVNPYEFTAWKEDLFYFEQTDLLSLMKVLGRWYNTTIVFKDEDIKQYRFTFWAKRSDNLKTTLSMLNQMGTVQIRINSQENTVLVSKR